jgi:hypothetical protein
LSMKFWNTAKYVFAMYRYTRRKSAKMDVSWFHFHFFSDFKKTETSFLISSDRVDTWVYHFTQTQQAGVRWKHPASPTVYVFWDADSVIHVECMAWCRSGNVNERILGHAATTSWGCEKETWTSLIRFDPVARYYNTTLRT